MEDAIVGMYLNKTERISLPDGEIARLYFALNLDFNCHNLFCYYFVINSLERSLD